MNAQKRLEYVRRGPVVLQHSMRQLAAGELPGASMRFMEVALALGAIVTAVLLGLIR